MSKIKSMLYALLVIPCLCAFQQGEAKPKMATSDWPVFEFAVGLHDAGSIPNFEYEFGRYRDTIKRFENGAVDLTFITLYDLIPLVRKSPGKYVVIAVIDYSNGGDA